MICFIAWNVCLNRKSKLNDHKFGLCGPHLARGLYVVHAALSQRKSIKLKQHKIKCTYHETGDLNSEKVESCKAFILMSLILKFHYLFQSMILIWKFLKLIMSKFVIFSFQRGNHVLKCAPRLQAFLIICWLGICKIIDIQDTPIFRLTIHNWSICSTRMPANNEEKLYGYFSQL